MAASRTLAIRDGPVEGSPFVLLGTRCNLRLVTNAMHEDDTLCLALTYRALRDVLRARFPRPAESHPQEEYDETSSCRVRIPRRLATTGSPTALHRGGTLRS